VVKNIINHLFNMFGIQKKINSTKMSCKLPNNKPLTDFRGRMFCHDEEERL